MTALQQWRTEQASGERTPATFDALWRAACLELSAHEAEAPQVRDAFLAEAKKLVPDSATPCEPQVLGADGWGKPIAGAWK